MLGNGLPQESDPLDSCIELRDPETQDRHWLAVLFSKRQCNVSILNCKWVGC